MAEKTMDNKDYADTLLLNMIDKYGIHVMYIVIIIELIHYLWYRIGAMLKKTILVPSSLWDK